MNAVKYIIFITICAAIGVGDYYVYLYVGLWPYVGLSLIAGLMTYGICIRNRRRDHELQLILAKYAVQTEDTITDLRKKGF